ncbi:MAG: EAL domain-containing protein [Pseudomonadota bacterium]|uniref:putative bifunctional diguanylate cyclase/phosphodiesterase n=1 Tax=Phenylobacterium sp. TaxID=1871053 RepID=UPI0025DE71C3|nr:EAL domain-containing protein [Phenylobacterium sp.]MBT9473304.1 EAL domain-containing protein [Phenylobacterium sp.]
MDQPAEHIDAAVAARRIERERRARREAEALLESKALELFQASQDLRQVSEALAGRVDELEAERALTLHLARTDGLTGLLNRGAFTAALIDRLEAAERSGEAVALFVIDLDRFKHLNDSLGHHAGDQLLNEIGRRLRAGALDGDVVSRLGGDEFAVIASGEGLRKRAQALTQLLTQTHTIYGRAIAPGASIGVAVFPADATDATDLQRFADMALYRAKAAGGSRWSAFDDELRQASAARHSLETELRRAIPAGDIVPWFQPVVDASDGRITAVEVLARWNHAERGMIPPGVFVPLAEELDLIAELDGALFQTACQRAAPWVAEGLIDTVSCNVSQRELLDPSFSRNLMRRLADTDLPATALTVEITETFLVHDLSMARRHIERLASRGVRIALDDFGTGYSNLRALLQLPIHTVKLDQSLIGGVGRDPRVSKLVRAMLGAAKSLDARIVAEGVEDEAQAIFLRAAGCDRMQGYLFARPMPADDVEALMRSQAAGAEAPTDRIMAAAATLRVGR